MSSRPFSVVLVLSLAGLLAPATLTAAEHPRLISQGPYVSPAIRDLPPGASTSGPPRELPVRRPVMRPGSSNVVDPVVQTSAATTASAQTLGEWEGLGQGYPGFSVTAVPPDPNMAVGPHHIVQWVNNAFVVFDRTGGQVLAPVSDGTFWGNSTCNQLGGFSDPIVQYDRASDRWLIGEVAIPLFPGLLGQFAQCFAVSTSPDPTGSYYMWAYGFGTTINDYPKIGVWPDGYYVTWNIFQNETTFTGPETCAWNRTDMLTGVAAPRYVCFSLSSAYASLLPADVDGPRAPPAGSPNFLMDIDPTTNRLNLWAFHVDFANPVKSTLTGPSSLADAAPFTSPCLTTQDCIPQPGTTRRLDALGDRLMYRLAYRNFGDHESLVATHTVVANGATGIRWYEIRNPNGSPTIYQQGTFAPDGAYRWMPSVAMDESGNIGVGYSVSSSGTFPSIRYSGWEVGNQLGTLQSETSLIEGGGSQTGYNRWGDYSAMRIDPTDDCLFWYTQEYQATTQTANWNTRIGSFRFPSCGQSLIPSATTLTSSASTTTVGQPVMFTATVSPQGVTGTVEFRDDSASLGTVPVSGGSAAINVDTLSVGTHSITALYSGDANHAGSVSSVVTHTVLEGVVSTTTALAASVNPSAFGQPVIFTATVAPSSGATGIVTFLDGALALGTGALDVTGVATLAVSDLAVGTHTITAQYGGDSLHASSMSSPLAQIVNQASTTTTLTSSQNPSKKGQTVTFTATISPAAATGSVQVSDNGVPLGTTTVSGGIASFSTSTLGGGKHAITAAYGGDSNFAGSTSDVLTENIVGKK
jgi:hypothetical protein